MKEYLDRLKPANPHIFFIFIFLLINCEKLLLTKENNSVSLNSYLPNEPFVARSFMYFSKMGMKQRGSLHYNQQSLS